MWRWIDEGAHLYVCGDAARMARDVDRALRGRGRRARGMAPDAAAAHVQAMAAAGRYVRDVF